MTSQAFHKKGYFLCSAVLFLLADHLITKIKGFVVLLNARIYERMIIFSQMFWIWSQHSEEQLFHEVTTLHYRRNKKFASQILQVWLVLQKITKDKKEKSEKIHQGGKSMTFKAT